MAESNLGYEALGDLFLGEEGLDDAPSGDVTLAGSSAGVAGVTGVLSVDIGLSASSAGVATVVGLLAADINLSGTSAGASTATGLLSREVELSGSSAGVATVVGALAQEVLLSGTSAGTSTAAAVLSPDIGLSGASAGTSTASAALTSDIGLHGTSAGVGTVSGALAADVGLTGSSAGTSTATSDLNVGSIITLSGSSAGTSSASATLDGGTTTVSISFLTDLGPFAMDPTKYAIAHETLLDIEAMERHEPVLVNMQARHPAFIRSQPMEQMIKFNVYLLDDFYQQRRDDYDDFVNALDSLSGLVTLRWISEDGTEKLLQVMPLSISPDAWFQRANAVLMSPTRETKVAA